MNRVNSKGPSTLPWGTPDVTGVSEEREEFSLTHCLLLNK